MTAAPGYPKGGIPMRYNNVELQSELRIGNFQDWLSVDVTAIPKGARSFDRENYSPISITPLLSKVYEKLASHKLSSFGEKYVFCMLLSLLFRKV